MRRAQLVLYKGAEMPEVTISVDSLPKSTYTVFVSGQERSGTIEKAEGRDGGNKFVCCGHHGERLKIARDEAGSWRGLGIAVALDLPTGEHIFCGQMSSL